MQPLNERYLHSDNVSYEVAENLDKINDFNIPNTIVTIAAAEPSIDTMWFVKITDECEMHYADDAIITIKQNKCFTEVIKDLHTKNKSRDSLQKSK